MAERLVDTSNSLRPGDDTYAEVIGRISEGGYCPFCPEHLAKNHPNPVFEENDHWLATENAFPYKHTNEHLLFIHKVHIEEVGDLTVEAWVDLLDLVKGVVRARNIQGSAFLMRNGDTRYTGASVSHLHAQLISGNGEDDGNVVLARVG